MKKRKKEKTATTPRRPACALLLVFFLSLPFLPTSTIRLDAREARRPTEYAVIFGTVWGPDDRPLSGVHVKLRRAGEKKARWETYSNRRGEFEFRLPAGRQLYLVWADLKGYKYVDHKHLNPTPSFRSRSKVTSAPILACI